MTILDDIIKAKRDHVAQCRKAVPLSQVEQAARRQSPPRGFAQALHRARAAGTIPLIAEIKKASPSRGLLSENFDPLRIARDYERGGAACLSILTDTPYFQGEDHHLSLVSSQVPLPVLRKDFMIDAYQIPQSRALGADCVLLILAALDDSQAADLAQLAQMWGMDVLLEVHNEDELARALTLPSSLLGINNRDLKTLTVSLTRTEQLAPLVPRDRLVVCESGIKNRQDIERMTRVGAGAFLIGESLMRDSDPAQSVQNLAMGSLPAHQNG